MPLKTADSRTCDKPMKAEVAAKIQPAGEDWQLGNRRIAAAAHIHGSDASDAGRNEFVESID